MKRLVNVLAITLVIILCSVTFFMQSGKAEVRPYVCFIALNDRLVPYEEALAYTQSGIVYVPASVLSEFGIYASLNTENGIAAVYSSAHQLYFDTVNGGVEDEDATEYSASSLARGSILYVPARFVSEFFGLGYSFMYDTGNGSVCRITDSNVVLDDDSFMSAAESQLESRYNSYVESLSGAADEGDEDGDDADENETTLYLSFQGLPNSELLDLLTQREQRATFFLSASHISGEPDIVRELVGMGHEIGILCVGEPATEYEEATELLFEVATSSTVLISAQSSQFEEICEAYATEQGLRYCDYDIDGVLSGAGIRYASQITSYLQGAGESITARIACTDTTVGVLSSILNHLESEKITVSPVSAMRG